MSIKPIVLPNIVAMTEQKRNQLYIKMERAMEAADVETMMLCLKQLVSSKPYTNDPDDRLVESDYQFILGTILSAANYYTELEAPTAIGRIDLLVKANNYIYLILR